MSTSAAGTGRGEDCAPIELRAIDEANFQQCLRLRASVADESFVDSVAYSLAEAYVYFPDARPFAIYEGARMVGFVLLYVGEENFQIINFLIDDAFQNRGLGTRAARACFKYLQREFGARRVSAPVKLEYAAGRAFWTKLGFRPSDCVEDGYVFMRRDLPGAPE